MKTFETMTIGGVYGNSYEAASIEEAGVMAIQDGYELIDYDDDNDRLIISARSVH